MADTAAGNAPTRADKLAALRDKPLSVLIVGGGINGIGLLREMALNGIDALLVEKGDFCSGTSSASTRAIHGGLRYLENGEFRLVQESLHERNRLLKNAPHYVRPLGTTIPIYSWSKGIVHAARKFFRMSSKPGDRGAVIIEVGMILYDLIGGSEGLPRHRFAFRKKALEERPQLNPDIVSAATYYDARIAYPERLCLELVMDSEATSPDVAGLNYVSVIGAEGGTVTLRDELTGETFNVKPQIVANATGAWIDFTNHAMKRESQLIGGTKGSHLVVDHPALWEATRDEMMYYANSDGRICIFYPFYDKVIVGATDLPASDPDAAVCDEDETKYLLASVQQVFPNIVLDHSHIVFRYCGVRPLPSSSAENSTTTGQISRDHSCPVIPGGNGVDFPVYNLVGGKWTTFRAFAEQVSDKLLAVFNKPRRTSTHEMAIGGGKGYPRTAESKSAWVANVSAKTGVPQERVKALLDRYGTRAEAVAAFIAAGDDQALQHHSDYSRRELQFLAANERVMHLDDMLLRRTLISFLGGTKRELLEEIAAAVAPTLGWSAAQVTEEVDRALKILHERHGVTSS